MLYFSYLEALSTLWQGGGETRNKTGRVLFLSLFLAFIAHLPSDALAASAGRPETTQNYSIPSGLLSEAISSFITKSGILLAAPGDLVQGKTSSPVTGGFTPEEALRVLLAGTGLKAIKVSDSQYRLIEDDSSAVRMPEIVVVEDGTTEGTGSYTTPVMRTATKLPLSIRETPQSVTVITKQRMTDQAMNTISDVMKHTPGITIKATAPYRETFYARGFSVDRYSFNGLASSVSSSRAAMFPGDMAMYDRVEVVRGASGLTQGAGNPSATINFVRKRPTRDLQASMEGSAGRWDNYSAQADVSSPLFGTEKLRARGVLYYKDGNSFQDIVDLNRRLAYFITEADITKNTLLALGFSYQKNDNTTGYSGIPTAPDGSDLNLPRSTFYGADWNAWDDSVTTLFAELSHTFDNDWKVSLAFNRMWGKQYQLRSTLHWHDEPDDLPARWRLNGGRADMDNDRTAYDVNTQGPVTVFGRDHDLIVGASRREAKDSESTAGYYTLLLQDPVRDIFDFDHDVPEPDFDDEYWSRSKTTEQGVYAAVRLNPLDTVKVILGGRFDWYKTRYASVVDNKTIPAADSWGGDYKVNANLTTYGGVIWDFHANHSVYVSYSDIFKPQEAYDYNNKLIDPIVGKNYEIGVKGEYFDGALNANAAVYRIDQENRAMSAGKRPDGSYYSKANGLMRSQGVDLEIQGALTPNWQLGVGYTYVTTKIIKDSNSSNEGKRQLTDTPTHQIKGSTTYRFDNGLRIGASARWQNKVYYDNSDYDFHVRQGSVPVVDAMIGYAPNESWDLQLNITNLFNRKYYSAIQAQPVHWGANAVYGEPLNVQFAVRYNF